MSDDVSIWLTEILISLGIVFGFFVVGKGLVLLIDKVLRKLTHKTETKLDDMLLVVVEKPVFYLFVLWGAFIGFHRLDLEMGEEVFSFGDKVAFILVVVLLVVLVYRTINTSLDWYAETSAEKGREEIGISVVPILKKLVKIFAFVSGAIVVLDHFEYDITSLVAALGVSSLAIGLAAKDTLSNMISGFIIMADRPFRVGDRIEADGRIGEVTEIGIRSTKMKTFENTIVIIPNTQLVDNVVLNYAYPENSLNYYYKIGVEYGSDIDRVRELLLEVAAGIEDIVADPPPAVFFTDHGDSALEFQMIYRISDYRQRWAALDKVNTTVNKRFAAEGISVAFPTRTVHLVQENK